MKKFTKISIATLAALSLTPATALAGTYSPSGAGSASGQQLEVRKGMTLKCDVNAGINSDGTISSSGAPSGTDITSISLSNGSFCGAVAFTNFPYDVSATSGTGIVIHDVVVQGITGDCRGDMAATMSGGVITFNHANTIPSDPPGGSPCSMAGSITTSPTASYTYP
ncbi:hypothetical protein [Sphingopyxis sp. MWB1]|uniref:hypothetical protein n=1 Tax=Sphingopyxis sp. MWB1 TaxID=1537715 RepID=UPI000519F220|nr:hypothetical protein [Sphingopyxis sp. MWB1]